MQSLIVVCTTFHHLVSSCKGERGESTVAWAQKSYEEKGETVEIQQRSGELVLTSDDYGVRE
jgi:hypothetical protein